MRNSDQGVEGTGGGSEHVGAGRGPLVMHLPRLGRIVVATTLVVWGLGILRELVIGRIGTQTLLEDMRQLALDVEHSLPAWYSSLLLVGCAALLLMIGRLTRREGGRDALRWLLLALLFAAMGLDEAVSFHEVLISPVQELLGTSGIFHFAWVIPGAIGVVVIGGYFVPFLLRLPRRTAVAFAASGAVYVGGALGMEMVGGAMAEAYGTEALPYIVAFVVEEGLEMLGLTGFLLALFDYVIRKPPGWASLILAGAPGQDALVPVTKPGDQRRAGSARGLHQLKR